MISFVKRSLKAFLIESKIISAFFSEAFSKRASPVFISSSFCSPEGGDEQHGPRKNKNIPQPIEAKTANIENNEFRISEETYDAPFQAMKT